MLSFSPIRRFTLSCCLLFLSGILVPGTIYGQDLNELLRLLEGGAAESESDEQMRQTIIRALEDFREGGIEAQAGALMLLGKYAHPEARAALYDGLGSEHVRVRRAALISVLENQRSIIPFAETERLLLMLGDEDVEIRRQISSVLPQLATSWRIGISQDRSRQTRSGWPQGFGESVVAAFRDEDATVRLNMVQNSSSVASTREILPLLAERLEDEDSRVRLLALRQGGRLTDSSDFVAAVRKIELGEDTLWDRELARQLVHHARHADARELLDELAQSGDQTTRIEAEISQLQYMGDDLERSPVFQRMMTESVSPDAVQRALRTIYGLERERAIDIAERLFEAESSVVRSEALTIWDSLFARLPDDEKVMRLLHDPSSRVRDLALRSLRNRWREVRLELLEKMVASHDSEIRLAVFRFLDERKPDELRPLLMPLLIDAETTVRARTLRSFAELELGGWQRILERSLRDPNTSIQEVAAQMLIAKRSVHPEGLRILSEWIATNPESVVAREFGPRVQRFLNASPSGE